LKAVADCQFVTVEMVAEDTKRNVIAVRRRMLQLFQAGFLNRARRDKLAPYVYFLSEKGSHEALRYGHLAEARFTKSKSSILVRHDLEITMFHRTLRKKLHDAGHILSEWDGAVPSGLKWKPNAGMNRSFPMESSGSTMNTLAIWRS
jgi:hypothetical protein